MRAIVMEEFGGPDVLMMRDVPVPDPGPDEVLIAVNSVSINPTLDFLVRAGRYSKPTPLPHILGVDPSGEIAAVGPGVTGRKVGDRVVTTPWVVPSTREYVSQMLGVQRWGGYAEYVCVPAVLTHKIPDGMDFPNATVIVRHAPLAFRMLEEAGQLQSGEWLLVTGAAGGLGSMAVQVGRLLGARVIAGTGDDERLSIALEAGAEFGINYRKQNLTQAVRELTGGKGVDVCIETTGVPEVFSNAFNGLARFARMVTAGGPAAGIASVSITHLYLNQISLRGRTGAGPADVERSLREADAGRLSAHIHNIHPLEDAPALHRELERSPAPGKVVLDPSANSALARR